MGVVVAVLRRGWEGKTMYSADLPVVRIHWVLGTGLGIGWGLGRGLGVVQGLETG